MLYQLVNKNAVEPVANQKSLGFYNWLFLVPKPNRWRPILDLSTLNTFLSTESFKINRFQGCILPHTNSQSVQEVQVFSYSGSVLPFQSLTLWPLHSTNGIHSGGQGGQTDGIRIHQYLDDWLVRATSHQTCLQHTQTLVALWLGCQFDLKEGKVRFTTDSWQALTDKIQTILSGLLCLVWQLMPLVGLLTATEKHLGQLHMRTIQWHLKNNWRILKSLEKVIPVPRYIHPYLWWWLEERNVLQGQPLHPLKHALQIFTDASKGGWGAHLTSSLPRALGPLHKACCI